MLGIEPVLSRSALKNLRARRQGSTTCGQTPFCPTVPAAYRTQLRVLHRSLGVPADYSSRRDLLLRREATRLISIGPAADDGKPVRLSRGAAKAWKRMVAAAAADGVVLLPLSGYRSVSRQAKIIRDKCAAGQSVHEILKLVAAPGYSEHHTGRALDIGTPGHAGLDEEFAQTKAYHWLTRQAGKHGFRLSFPRGNRHGIGFEPWHWYWFNR